MLQLLQAEKRDLLRIVSFYTHVIENTKNMETYARWKKDLYPTAEDISSYLEKEAMYLYVDGETITGAMAVTMEQGAEYHNVSWEVEAEDNETAVIHILAVSPSYQGSGIGKRMIDEAVRLARGFGKKTVRLDALVSNVPARQMYEEKGFVYRGKQNLFAGNTGWTDFFFYELIL